MTGQDFEQPSRAVSESKKSVSVVRKPSVALAAVRVVVLTVLFTLMGFVVALFLAIVGIVLVNMVRGGGINMIHAYRSVALPAAIGVGAAALILSAISEIRSYRRRKAEARDYLRAA